LLFNIGFGGVAVGLVAGVDGFDSWASPCAWFDWKSYEGVALNLDGVDLADGAC